MDDDNKFSYFFLGLGLGVAAGLLFAPKSGPLCPLKLEQLGSNDQANVPNLRQLRDGHQRFDAAIRRARLVPVLL